MADLSEVTIQEAVRKQTLRMACSVPLAAGAWGLCLCSNFRIARGCFQSLEEKDFSESRELLNCSYPHPHGFAARQAHLLHGQGSEGIMKRQWLVNQSRCL